jgi:hypothetical protein
LTRERGRKKKVRSRAGLEPALAARGVRCGSRLPVGSAYRDHALRLRQRRSLAQGSRNRPAPFLWIRGLCAAIQGIFYHDLGHQIGASRRHSRRIPANSETRQERDRPPWAAQSTERQSSCKWPFVEVANRASPGGPAAKSGGGQGVGRLERRLARSYGGSERRLPRPHGRFGALRGVCAASGRPGAAVAFREGTRYSLTTP